jgi:hypothetical protein
MVRRSVTVTLLLLCLTAGLALAIPSYDPSEIDVRTVVDSNNLRMHITNLGVFAYDLTGSGVGLEFPIGSGKGLTFAAGLWVGGLVDGDTLMALGSYIPEYSPGPIDEFGQYADPTDPRHRVYKIERGDTTSDDYLEWPSEFGAPTDEAGRPMLTGEQTLWCVYNDANPDRHVAFGGGTAPLGIEVQKTVHAFGPPLALGNVVFLEFTIINKLANTLDSAYVTVWCDPDLGDFSDDLAGCDTLLDIGFAYNGFNTDDVYGSNPPCLGIDLLKGIMGDDGERLPMTSFRRHETGDDPTNPSEVYNQMRGLLNSGNPIIDPSTGLPTKYEVPGDPLTNTQWLDFVPGDRRFLLSSGPFTLEPGDTNDIAVALIAARGSRLGSVRNMKLFDRVAQVYFDGRQGGMQMAAFDAVEDAKGLRLEWTNPDSPDVEGTIIRYSTVEFPGSPSEGAPVPNAQNGFFPGERGMPGIFTHANVEPGVAYYYSAFAVLSQASHELFGLDSATPLGSAGVPAAEREGTEGGRALTVLPNPTRGRTTIRYSPSRGAETRVEIFTTSGRLVRALKGTEAAGGLYEATWDGMDKMGNTVHPGIYFIRVRAGASIATEKIVLLK